MAYMIRRSIISSTSRARLLFAQQQFTDPSISSYYTHNHEQEEGHRKYHQHSGSFLQSRWYSVSGFRDPRWSRFSNHAPITASIGFGLLLPRRNMSTQAAVSEVAIATADSWLPSAAFQYAFDGIHNFTGLNWWASIAIATVIIRTLSIPISIKIQKEMSKLAIIAPKLQDIKQEVQDENAKEGHELPSIFFYLHYYVLAKLGNRISEYEGQERIQKLCKEHGLTSLVSPYKWVLIQGPVFVSFFLAIRNMVEKVPSFKTGGASWFLDLTTADPFCILPCMAALTLWVNIELNTQEGLEGNPTGGTMKNVQRALTALSIPFTAAFPKALFCYWITSNLFSLVYGLTIKRPTVKKWLNIPIPPPPSPGSQLKPAFSFFEQWKKYAEAQAALELHQVEERNSSVTNRSIRPSKKPTSEEHIYQRVSSSSVTSSSSSSVLNYKIVNLENKVKRRKKNKRR